MHVKHLVQCLENCKLSLNDDNKNHDDDGDGD